jgi:hypothetical protein
MSYHEPPMSEPGLGDRYLARLIARPASRWTLMAVFSLTAAADLCFRVWMGRPEQVLPWYFGFLALYGAVMLAASRDVRSRAAYACFAVLVAASFTRVAMEDYTRAVGAIEVVCCLMLLWSLTSLARDAAWRGRCAVLESGRPGHQPPHPPGGDPLRAPGPGTEDDEGRRTHDDHSE